MLDVASKLHILVIKDGETMTSKEKDAKIKALESDLIALALELKDAQRERAEAVTKADDEVATAVEAQEVAEGEKAQADDALRVKDELLQLALARLGISEEDLVWASSHASPFATLHNAGLI